MREESDITWTDYVIERCLKVFGSDDLENDNIREFVIQHIIKDNRTVRIEQDPDDNEWIVVINDDENKSWKVVIALGKDKETCEKWIVDNKLTKKD